MPYKTHQPLVLLTSRWAKGNTPQGGEEQRQGEREGVVRGGGRGEGSKTGEHNGLGPPHYNR